MRLFKAMPKPLDRVPTWSNCCEESVIAHQEMIDHGEMLLDLDRTSSQWMICSCGNRVKEPAAPDVRDHNRMVHLEDCDIDEEEFKG